MLHQARAGGGGWRVGGVNKGAGGVRMKYSVDSRKKEKFHSRKQSQYVESVFVGLRPRSNFERFRSKVPLRTSNTHMNCTAAPACGRGGQAPDFDPLFLALQVCRARPGHLRNSLSAVEGVRGALPALHTVPPPAPRSLEEGGEGRDRLHQRRRGREHPRQLLVLGQHGESIPRRECGVVGPLRLEHEEPVLGVGGSCSHPIGKEFLL